MLSNVRGDLQNEAVRNGEDEMIIKQHQRNIEEFIG